MDPVKAIALRTPLAPWEFPNGVVCEVRVVDGYIQRLIREAQAAPPDKAEDAFMAVYRLLVPAATEADWESMTEEDFTNLLLHAGRKLAVVQAVVEERRKNGDAGTGDAPHSTETRADAKSSRRPSSPRSSRTTTSSTSAGA